MVGKMPNKTQPFHQHLITRGLRAQAAAGIPNPSVQVHLPDGRKFVFGSDKGDAASGTKRASPPMPVKRAASSRKGR
jgi:hypothetical protein